MFWRSGLKCAFRILFRAFWTENREFSSVDRRSWRPLTNAWVHPSLSAVGRATGRRGREYSSRPRSRPVSPMDRFVGIPTDARSRSRGFRTLRISSLRKKYGCSRLGSPSRGGNFFMKNDHSSDACNSSTARCHVNLILGRRRSSRPQCARRGIAKGIDSATSLEPNPLVGCLVCE